MTCPNCWHPFLPEEVLFIAKHPDLLGDPVAGPDEYRRFAPMRFNLKGEALDERGMATTDLACPRCHLPVSEAMLEVEPIFMSIVGATASGKSYLLTSMCWELRRLMPQVFLSFSDADPAANRAIHEYEETLFLNPHPDRPTEIRATQPDDRYLHRSAIIEGATVRFPIPLTFTLWPTPEHPHFDEASRIGRIAVLYDNSGEDFQPGRESGDSQVVQHLAESRIIFFLFDPTQDPRLRPLLESEDPQLKYGLHPGERDAPAPLRQETLLREMGVRLRRYLGIAQDKRIDKPVVVIVPKFDVCADSVGVDIDTEPYAVREEDVSLELDLERIETASNTIRAFLRRHCPEFVATADGLIEHVRYIPVSSLGRSPELVEDGDLRYYGIRPRDITPRWVAVPMLYCLSKWASELVTPSTHASGN